jgi:hypothetical protein
LGDPASLPRHGDRSKDLGLRSPRQRPSLGECGAFYRFTVAELEQMTAAGILAEDERTELIGGEVVPMSAKGSHHEILKTALSGDLLFTTETTFRLSAHTYLEPDFVFYPKAAGWQGLSAATARLVVEIADTSLGL